MLVYKDAHAVLEMLMVFLADFLGPLALKIINEYQLLAK